MADRPSAGPPPHVGATPEDAPPRTLPVLGGGAPPAAEPAPPVAPPPAPRKVGRGVVLFDLDGTLLDDLALIGDVAAKVIGSAFGIPEDEARIHYLATTGMPFEAQLAQLFPAAPAALRAQTARTFHQRKVTEAYAKAKPFPEVPRTLRRLDQGGWTLGVTTGAETEMAELLLEREGLRYWFEGVLGSASGTKREHLVEYGRRYPDVPLFLVGDSRFDMEAAGGLSGVTPIGRASRLSNWTLTPKDLEGWGAAWADYTLTELPEVLERLLTERLRPRATRRPAARARRRSSS